MHSVYVILSVDCNGERNKGEQEGDQIVVLPLANTERWGLYHQGISEDRRKSDNSNLTCGFSYTL